VYTRSDNQSIMFPTTLSARLPAFATGTLTSVDVDAQDAAGASVASGHAGSVTIHAGERETITIRLDCGGSACVVDGGAGDNDGGAPPPSCGNGRVDQGETCDTAIAAGQPGACPTSCDDHIACTDDTMTGSECTLSCAHELITTADPHDGCCPANTAAKDDSNCSQTCGDGVVDLGETCDTAIPHGSPGACPTAEDCGAGASCASNLLVSAGTCSAVCMHYPIVAQLDGDGCCPPGATHGVDDDCPVVCGNGIVEPGEICDTAIAALLPGACPTGCPSSDPCMPRILSGSGCQAACSAPIKITAPVSGDGCCPEGANQMTDSDCTPVCGNNVIERGEACDNNRIANPKGNGSCQTSCPPVPDTPSSCLRTKVVGSVDDCTAHCEVVEETECLDDGCCPATCTPDNDPDCTRVASSCGDGAVEASKDHRELCDIGAPFPPTACPTSCDDTKACTQDILVSAGTCAAACMHVPTTSFRPGDGCCAFAAGANFTLDPDCAPVCGNGVVESPAESCDFAVPGSCPTPNSCPPPTACTRYVVQGTSGACSAACVAQPIVACANGDHCCPPGCAAANDDDCPIVCGNGIVEAGETCDRAITAGLSGTCPRSCDDGDACTTDLASGSTEACTRTCAHLPVTGCVSGDGCCPPGCSADADHDCAPRCGDRQIGAGETCDPPASCPTTCPEDGDPCTVEQLAGDAASCTAVCRHVPITSCSGPTAGDGCCPSGCSAANDSDCP
jgi:hypothetical protein